MSQYKKSRDEAAETYDALHLFAAAGSTHPRIDVFKAGHDHGVFNSPEVLALESALFLLLKRVTKLGAIKAEPDSPIDRGWKALDAFKAAKKEAGVK